MAPFAGFPSGKVRMTAIPGLFFSDLLPTIDHLGELKVTLYAFWFLDKLEAPVRYMTYDDFASDDQLVGGLQPDGLDAALKQAVERGTILVAERSAGSEEREALYFLNTPRGRAAVQAIQEGKWQPEFQAHLPLSLAGERPNIYRLYEENIGPLTPIISDMLREAEQTYRQEWIEEALKIAVQNNVRRWKYIEAILRSWKEEGRDGTTRQDSEKDRRKYIEGEFADFIEH